MADFQAVEARLRSIFDPYRESLSVSKDGPDGIYLEVPGYEGKPWGYESTRSGARCAKLVPRTPPDGDARLERRICAWRR